jgi:hypothetical protein
MIAQPTPAIPLPDPVPMPAPAWLLWALLLVTFYVHVLLMNTVLGGSIIGAIAHARGRRRESAHAAALARWFAHALPTLVAAAVTFGVAALLFLQVLYGRLFFVSSILMAWSWLAIVPLLIVAYYGRYALAGTSRLASSFAIAAGTAVLFVAIAFVQSNNMSLMLRPETFAAQYLSSGRGFHLNLGDASLAPRFLHVLVGAVAVAGVVVAGLGVVRRKADPAFGAWAVRHGIVWCAACTVVNVLSGFWWLAALRREVLLRFLGGDLFQTAVLFGGILAAIVTLVTVLLAAWAPEPGGLVRASAGGMAATLLLMLLVRDRVRAGTAELAGFLPMNWIEPQWLPVSLFLVLFVVAFATVGWMVGCLVRAGKPGLHAAARAQPDVPTA